MAAGLGCPRRQRELLTRRTRIAGERRPPAVLPWAGRSRRSRRRSPRRRSGTHSTSGEAAAGARASRRRRAAPVPPANAAAAIRRRARDRQTTRRWPRGRLLAWRERSSATVCCRRRARQRRRRPRGVPESSRPLRAPRAGGRGGARAAHASPSAKRSIVASAGLRPVQRVRPAGVVATLARRRRRGGRWPQGSVVPRAGAAPASPSRGSAAAPPAASVRCWLSRAVAPGSGTLNLTARPQHVSLIPGCVLAVAR